MLETANIFKYAVSDIDNRQRSIFPIKTSVISTMSAGSLVPMFCFEIYPGDTFDLDLSSFARMLTPIHPVMDNAWLDVYAFFCPNRLVYDKWPEFMGQLSDDPYITNVDHVVPHLKPYSADEILSLDPENGSLYDTKHIPHSVADYMSLPLGVTDSENALPYRGFALIWNQWFRDQNLQNAIYIPMGDADEKYACPINTPVYYVNSGGTLAHTDVSRENPDAGQVLYNNIIRPYDASDDYVHSCAYGGTLPPVNKLHDYFTSCLISPERSESPVAIPLSGFSPVVPLMDVANQIAAGTFMRTNNGTISEYDGNVVFEGNNTPVNPSTPSNLFADLSNTFSNGANAYATINDLRFAFATSALLTNDALFGGRYTEQIKAHFGVNVSSGLLQRTEFLAGNRIRIGMQQVVQTSSTDDVSPQGNVSAYSLTTDSSTRILKSFQEHGFCHIVCCIRTDHTYSQGIPKMFSRRERFDYMFPEFSNIAEQPVYTREIYVPPIPSSKFSYDEIFGYQEPWQDLRQYPRRITGSMRPDYARSLDVWHYGDDYIDAPVLSDLWIRETRSNIDRTLAVSSNLEDQFLVNFSIIGNKVSTLPIRSRIGTHL